MGATLSALPAVAGQVLPGEPIRAQATAPPVVESSDYLLLPGNVHPALASARQLGPVEAQTPMERMILALKLATGAEPLLDQFLADLQDGSKPDYHRWLSPAQFGARFGPSREDLVRVTDWLEASGFQVDEVAAGRMSILFSGTVEQVERAFQTPIRIFEVGGEIRQANASEPSIPRALADVVEGVVSLHNLPHPAMNTGVRPAPRGKAWDGDHTLTPGDFATIYGVAPLYQAGIDGTGVSLAIVGRTHIPLADIARFRKVFGLPARVPDVIINGPDPGDMGSSEDAEADLDVEWSGAVARNADIKFVVSASTDSTDGVDLSARAIVDRNLAPVMSTSFGQCEAQLGAVERAFFRNLWAQAAAQGISSLVASGDSGPAGCNGGSDDEGSGRAVSGLASTPFNVAVGGTRFHEGAGTYWRAHKAKDGSSAISYIPEQAWNESGSSPDGYGLWASGGGPSSFHPRPSWQIFPCAPGDLKHRVLPDVSLAAAGGHDGYVIETQGQQAVIGGTSCASPAFAGILALVVQRTGERQGNPNPVFYQLAGAQYRGEGPLVFHDVIQGDTNVPGTQGYPCLPGYDLATGLGSVDAQALVGAWPPASASPAAP